MMVLSLKLCLTSCFFLLCASDRSDVSTMTSIGRLERVLRQEARQPSRLQLLQSFDGSESGVCALG